MLQTRQCEVSSGSIEYEVECDENDKTAGRIVLGAGIVAVFLTLFALVAAGNVSCAARYLCLYLYLYLYRSIWHAVLMCCAVLCCAVLCRAVP